LAFQSQATELMVVGGCSRTAYIPWKAPRQSRQKKLLFTFIEKLSTENKKMLNSPFNDKTPSFFSAFRIRIGLNADPNPDPDPENLHLFKIFLFLNKTNCYLLGRRRSYVQRKPSTLKREHPELNKKKKQKKLCY
jgi:hypothetical protein